MESQKVRVLIADDVQETRRSIRLMLSTIPDVEVVAMAQNGRQAVDLAAQFQPDLALMDVNMPEMDGLSAIRSMLDARSDLVCLVISAERDSHTLRQAMSAGARAYLIKPFTTDELEEVIHQAMGQVKRQRTQQGKTEEMTRERDVYLLQLANEYAASRRSDPAAVKVFETLASDPQCETRWLMTLAMVYVVRKDWGKLKLLAERLERREE
jgi:YesN/AraC family two-component response regulator